MDLGPILAQVAAGDPVGAAYRLAQALGAGATGRSFYEAGATALSRRGELGDDAALRFARLVFAEAVERDPELADAHHDLATTMRELGMAQDAVRHYRRALELLPNDLDSIVGLGAALSDGGDLDGGIATLYRATETHPESGKAFANLGVALEAAGRDEEAVGAYAKAVARFHAQLEEAADDDILADAALARRWARIQHAELLERLQRWPQALVEYRHLYEEEQAIAEAEEEAAADEEDDDEAMEDEALDLPDDAALRDDETADGTPDRDVGETLLDVGTAAPDGASAGDKGQGGDEDEDDDADEEDDAGRRGLERVFTRLVQLGRADLAYVALDQLGGELSDERTRATYAIYDPGDGTPRIMVEHWDSGRREQLDPAAER